jgi:hypothetical protein
MAQKSTQVLNSSRFRQLFEPQVSERIFQKRKVRRASIPPSMGIFGNLGKPQSFAAEFNFAEQPVDDFKAGEGLKESCQ